MGDVDERWLANQDKFELHQLQKSALLRVIDSRGTPIDYLAAYPALLQGGFEQESQHCSQLPTPQAVLTKIEAKDLSTLAKEIEAFRKVDKRPLSIEFWRNTVNFIDMKLNRAQDSEAVTVVQPDVSNVIGTKSDVELKNMELELIDKCKGDNSEYWQGVLELAQQAQAERFFENVAKLVNQVTSEQTQVLESEEQSPFKAMVLSKLDSNEQVFSSLNGEPGGIEYVARAIVGTSANYQAHNFPETHLSNLVQGYKFSVYYPRLIESKTLPDYALKKNSDGTCTLTFTAKSYPDLRFRILDEPWEKQQYGVDRFRSTFEKGVLTLEFRFKFHYYKN